MSDWDPALDCEIQDLHAKDLECCSPNYHSNAAASSVANGVPAAPPPELLKALSADAVSNASAVRKALEAGAENNPNGQEQLTGQTALLCAVRGQHHTLARSLLHAQALVNTGDFKGVTPLMVAASAGNRALTMLLLEHAADLSARTMQGIDALRLAAQHGHMPIVRLLLESGAPLENAKDGTAPQLKVSQCNHKDVVKLLKSHRAQPNVSQTEPTRTTRVRVKNAPLIVGRMQQQMYPAPPPKVTQEMPVFHRPPVWDLKTVEGASPSNPSDPVSMSDPNSTDSGGGSKTESSEAEPAAIVVGALPGMLPGENRKRWAEGDKIDTSETEPAIYRENRQRWVDMADSQDVGISGIMQEKAQYYYNSSKEAKMGDRSTTSESTMASSDPPRVNQKKTSRRQRQRNPVSGGYSGNYPALQTQYQ